MQNDHRKRQRGYTLSEVLVAVAVFAIVILAALAMYDRSNRVFRQGVQSSNLQQNTRVAFNKLVSDLRMTGFDFDRDGIPTGAGSGGTNQYQQPDEQFEYIGPAAVTIRGNFDFERESAPCAGTVTDNCDNGREKTYESSYFPVVTTGNDEIVTYALVPDSQTTIPACDPMTNCVEFYADTHIPRKSYPDTGGLDETLVQIPGVDLCMSGCNNPPYTLYRFTLARNATNFANGQNVVRTPLASNIRSMSFRYFQDAQGLEVLRNLDNTGDLSTGATVRGLGQYRVSAAGVPVSQRLIRSKINSLRVELIGMNEMPDRDYRNPAETLAAVQNFRTYRLETLVAPRNIQRRGMREQAAFPPGPPTNLQICNGPCGGVYLTWDAPAETAVHGAPDQYQILVDEASASGWACSLTVFSGTSAHVFRTSCGPLTPNVNYKFAVAAINDFGSATSATTVNATPLNYTQAQAPELLSATHDQNGQVTLTWSRPETNAINGGSCSGNTINPAEILGYRVERAPDVSGSPGTWVTLGSGDVTMSSPHDEVTWTDTTAVNCVLYHYRVSLVERCALQAAYNFGGNQALGSSDPSNTMTGEATSTALPKTPLDLEVKTQGSLSATGDALLSWPHVNADVNDEPINIRDYIVYRRLLGSTTWDDTFAVTVDPAQQTVTYLDAAVPLVDADGNSLAYQYTVAAVQDCDPPLESAPFAPARLWPCSFPTGVVTGLSVPGAFDGNGSAASPWLVQTGPSVTVELNLGPNGGLIQQVDARVYAADGEIIHVFPSLTAGPFRWTWDAEDGAVERIVVTIADTSGCTMVTSTWVSDAAQACCLVPESFDGTVVNFVAGNAFVDFFLKNICSERLNMATQGQVVLTWDPPGGGTRVDNVSFPNTAGTRTQVALSNQAGSSASITVTAPADAAPVAAGSTTYRVRVNFTRAFASNPITSFAVHYRRPSSLATEPACPIVVPTAVGN